jgi:L-fuconolactonase
VEETASDDFRRRVESLPDLKIIIEHLGCRKEDATPPYNTYRRILALARYPNTFMKVPGLGEICQRPAHFPQPLAPFEHIPPVIEMAMDSFGVKRLMWGSDYPHVAEREGYGNCLRLLMEHVVKKAEDKEWVFGKTAATLFRFGEPL